MPASGHRIPLMRKSPLSRSVSWSAAARAIGSHSSSSSRKAITTYSPAAMKYVRIIGSTPSGSGCTGASPASKPRGMTPWSQTSSRCLRIRAWCRSRCMVSSCGGTRTHTRLRGYRLAAVYCSGAPDLMVQCACCAGAVSGCASGRRGPVSSGLAEREDQVLRVIGAKREVSAVSIEAASAAATPTTRAMSPWSAQVNERAHWSWTASRASDDTENEHW